MENQNATPSNETPAANGEAAAAQTFTLSIRAVLGNSPAADAESATCWTGRGDYTNPKTPRRDLLLSEPMPKITAETIAQLPQEKLAELLSDLMTDYIRRTKCQRMSAGDLLQFTLPREPLAYAMTALIACTEGSGRATSELSGATIRELINSKEYAAARLEYCTTQKINPANFIKIVQDEFLRSSTRVDLTVWQSRSAVMHKAIAHLTAIGQLAGITEKQKRVLTLACGRLANAQVIDDNEGGI